MPPYPTPDELPEDLRHLGRDPWYSRLAYRSDILRPWAELDQVFFGATSLVDNEIKEEARRTLARGAGCVFCASLGQPRAEHPSRKEELAAAYAELISNDHRQVDAGTFAVLREEFTDAEIVELTAWICFKLGSNIFGALMGLDPATPEQIKGYEDFVAQVPVAAH